jgi:hypothetical protein
MSFGVLNIAPLLPEFLAAYPEVSVDLHLTTVRSKFRASAVTRPMTSSVPKWVRTIDETGGISGAARRNRVCDWRN